jgi:hypothetical protein
MATGKAPKAAQTRQAGFKGNKSFLPSKPCASCGLPMTWRKRWAKTWDEVRYCSDACRRSGPKAP